MKVGNNLMKKLNQFTLFDWNSFQKGKTFVCIGISPWKDFESGEIIGTKVESVIASDETNYNVKDGETVTNLYEKLVFKVNKDIDIPINAVIHPKGVQASVFGEYRNQLSCTAEDIVIVSKN